MSRISLKRGEKILIAPYSPLSMAMKKAFEREFEIEFLGYIDSTKSGDDIYKTEQLHSLKYEHILILSPNHALFIYDNLQKKLHSSKIKIVSLRGGHYFFTNVMKLKLENFIQYTQVKFLQYAIKVCKKFVEDRDHILLLAPDFVDNNIKDLYLYIDEDTKFRATIATNNSVHYEMLKSAGFNIITYPSFMFVYYVLKSYVKILDHTPNSPLLKIAMADSYSVQIWHGIALKKIGGADYKDIVYDLFISTSDYVTQKNFKDTFAYKKIINSSYPRCDLFSLEKLSDKERVFTDHEIYDFVLKSDAKTIIYMPTYRENSYASNPIDFDELNAFAKEFNLFIIIKLHPFSSLGMFDTLFASEYKFRPNYTKNITFYPEGRDIYPILKLSDLLITDYSSIYFDYLLLNKPILFFVYDKEEYVGSRGDFMLDFETHTPGEKCYSFDDLKQSIINQLQNDTFAKEREALKSKLYEKIDFCASEMILESIRKDLSEQR